MEDVRATGSATSAGSMYSSVMAVSSTATQPFCSYPVSTSHSYAGDSSAKGIPQGLHSIGEEPGLSAVPSTCVAASSQSDSGAVYSTIQDVSPAVSAPASAATAVSNKNAASPRLDRNSTFDLRSKPRSSTVEHLTSDPSVDVHRPGPAKVISTVHCTTFRPLTLYTAFSYALCCNIVFIWWALLYV